LCWNILRNPCRFVIEGTNGLTEQLYGFVGFFEFAQRACHEEVLEQLLLDIRYVDLAACSELLLHAGAHVVEAFLAEYLSLLVLDEFDPGANIRSIT
jgi:hypothetical protein